MTPDIGRGRLPSAGLGSRRSALSRGPRTHRPSGHGPAVPGHHDAALERGRLDEVPAAVAPEQLPEAAVDPAVGAQQTARLQTLKAGRDNAAVKAALAGLKEAAQGTDNLMPFLIDTVKTYATLGEICGVLREVFGEYKAEADI